MDGLLLREGPGECPNRPLGVGHVKAVRMQFRQGIFFDRLPSLKAENS
jgi:hypothetical protein